VVQANNSSRKTRMKRKEKGKPKGQGRRKSGREGEGSRKHETPTTETKREGKQDVREEGKPNLWSIFNLDPSCGVQ
jgi:hypothetical protein